MEELRRKFNETRDLRRAVEEHVNPSLIFDNLPYILQLFSVAAKELEKHEKTVKGDLKETLKVGKNSRTRSHTHANTHAHHRQIYFTGDIIAGFSFCSHTHTHTHTRRTSDKPFISQSFAFKTTCWVWGVVVWALKFPSLKLSLHKKDFVASVVGFVLARLGLCCLHNWIIQTEVSLFVRGRTYSYLKACLIK